MLVAKLLHSGGNAFSTQKVTSELEIISLSPCRWSLSWETLMRKDATSSSSYFFILYNLFRKYIFCLIVLTKYKFISLSYIALEVFKFTINGTREFLIDSTMILSALAYPFLYFSSSCVLSLLGSVISPVTYSITYYYLSMKSILFFHAR